MRKEVRINSEGRIVIPSEMRKALKLVDSDVVVIEYGDGTLTVKPKAEQCIICKSTNDLITKGNFIVCKKCLETITQF